jgi:chromosomal replication initiator protein
MIRDYATVWDSCLRTIKKSVNAQSFKTWFEPIKPVKLDTASLTIQVPNKFFYEWLEEHYVALLKTTIRQELGDKGRLEYQILNGGQQERNRPAAMSMPYPAAAPASVQSTRDRSRDTSPSPVPSDSASNPGSLDAENIKNPFVIPGIRRVKIDPQLNNNYGFDNLIEGDCNRLARSAGMAVAKKPGGTAFNPLFVFGGVGLGKTHLIQAIGNEIVKKDESKNVLYVSCEKFGNQVIQAIKNNAVNDLVNFYQMIDVLIVDDIQFLSGKQKTQEIFFHIFNQLHQSGKQLIFTSDKPPKDLDGMEERLISRFKWGLSADLQVPDLETRIAILESKMTQEGVEIPNNVTEFISYNVKNNIRELEGVLISLIAQAMLNRREIDMDLAKDVIKNFVQNINKEITVDFIKKIVAEHFNVPMDKLQGETRKRQIVIARQLSMYLAKNMTNTSLKAIGEQFGGRDHSTVIHSCRAVQDLMDTDIIFKDTVSDLEKKIKLSLNGA